MTPERWQEVKKVLAGALERAPGERRVYLDQRCSDPDLRREVESLIVAQEQGDTDFLQTLTPTNDPTLSINSKLNHYEILARIGAGGMGVVYKARDTKLGRLVALKLLPNGALADQAARARLVREAQSASALNHPNIATIFEVGEDAGQIYIAMELVEGRPLNAVIPHDGLAVETAVRFALEISAALSHAHERGIVHRDLKPANVVITADGRAKILDFGLAKRFSANELSEVTRSQNSLTEAGAIVGTLQYMAPETLRGQAADARTDIWSAGVICAEMLAGAPPFRGRTPFELTSAILREPARPLPPHVPAGLQSAIHRCLAKEPERRYQSAAELRAVLEAIALHAAPAQVSAAARPRPKWFPIGVAIGAVVLLAVGGYWLFRPKAHAPATASQADWVQLTDFADSVVSPALSPDGRMLAFIRGERTFYGVGEIYVKLLPNGEPVQLTHDHSKKMSPQFSPDSSTIPYTVTTDTPFAWHTWVVPALGGEPHLMLPNAEGLNWIDGGHLLFSEIKTGVNMAVVTASESRAESRDIYRPARERGMAHRSALSPDRKWVLVAEMDNGGWLPCRVLPFDGSSIGQRVGPQGAGCTYVAWSPDGAWMYFSSDSGGRFHIWRQRFPDGEPQQVTSGATEEEGIAVAPDGTSLITSVGLTESTLWVRDASGERQVTSEGYAEFPHFTLDGKKLYYLVRRRGITAKWVDGELWVTDLTTNRSQRLLPEFLVSGYDISADGTKVVFCSADKQGHLRLWVVPLDLSAPPRQFSSSANEDQPIWDTAGHIYFRAAEGSANFLYRMNGDGSDRIKILSDPIGEFETVSPDGKWALVRQAHGQDARYETLARQLEGDASVTVCPGYCLAQWSPDGRTFSIHADTMAGTKTLLLPVPPGSTLPNLPAGGVRSEGAIETVKGARAVSGSVVPGPTSALSASIHHEVHRNLYRIPLP